MAHVRMWCTLTRECYNCANVTTYTRVTRRIRMRAMMHQNKSITSSDVKHHANYSTFFSLYFYFPTADVMRASCVCYNCENVMRASWLTCERAAPQWVHHTMISADAKGASHEFCSTFFFPIFFPTADVIRASHECYKCEHVMSASRLTCERAAPQRVHHTMISVSCECHNCANVTKYARVTWRIRMRAMMRQNERITTSDAKGASYEFCSTIFFSDFFFPTSDAMRASCECYNCGHVLSASWLACERDASWWMHHSMINASMTEISGSGSHANVMHHDGCIITHITHECIMARINAYEPEI